MFFSFVSILGLRLIVPHIRELVGVGAYHIIYVRELFVELFGVDGEKVFENAAFVDDQCILEMLDGLFGVVVGDEEQGEEVPEVFV